MIMIGLQIIGTFGSVAEIRIAPVSDASATDSAR